MKLLLSRIGININEKNEDGETAVQLSIKAGNVFGEENTTILLL